MLEWDGQGIPAPGRRFNAARLGVGWADVFRDDGLRHVMCPLLCGYFRKFLKLRFGPFGTDRDQPQVSVLIQRVLRAIDLAGHDAVGQADFPRIPIPLALRALGQRLLDPIGNPRDAIGMGLVDEVSRDVNPTAIAQVKFGGFGEVGFAHVMCPLLCGYFRKFLKLRLRGT